jgi:hypothetical protein
MPRASNHAGVTVCNRDRESGFPKCLPLPGDPLSNFHRVVILLCYSSPVWVPVLPLELLPHSPTRCEDDRYKVHTTLSLAENWHRSHGLYLLVFVVSADLVPAFGLREDSPHAPAPEWLTAVGFTMLTSKATLFRKKGLPQTCPSVQLRLCACSCLSQKCPQSCCQMSRLSQ